MTILIFVIILLLILNKRKLTKIEEASKSILTKKELIRKITLAAIFMALAYVLKSFSISTGEIRLGFYEVPVFLSGMLLGPLFGSLVGIGSDMLYSLTSGYTYSFIMMCSALLWGLLGGLFYKRKAKFVPTLIVCLIASVVATSINSVQLYIYYGMGMFGNLPNRIITMLIKWPLLSVICWLLNEKVIKVIIKKIYKK